MKKTINETINIINSMINNIDHPTIISEQTKYYGTDNDFFDLMDFLDTIPFNKTFSGEKKDNCLLTLDHGNVWVCMLSDKYGRYNGDVSYTKKGSKHSYTLEVRGVGSSYQANLKFSG